LFDETSFVQHLEKIFLLSFIFFSFFAILLFANKVSGIVDKADQPVPFANITFKDSNEGAFAL
jgi:hypothetical protein